jgi:hypothetical protein
MPFIVAEINVKYGIAFTENGHPNDRIVGWWSNESDNQLFLTDSRDEALSQNDENGWTGYVKEYVG